MYSGASALLLDCTIADCNAARGGGIWASRANLTLKGSRVQRCHSSRGGGIQPSFCNMELLEGSIVTECTGDFGGGMCAGLRRTCLHRATHSLEAMLTAIGLGRHWGALLIAFPGCPHILLRPTGTSTSRKHGWISHRSPTVTERASVF